MDSLTPDPPLPNTPIRSQPPPLHYRSLPLHVMSPLKCTKAPCQPRDAPTHGSPHIQSSPRGHCLRGHVPRGGRGGVVGCAGHSSWRVFPLGLRPPLLSPMSGTVTLQGWRRPKTRTVMPRPPNHKANGGGATNNGSTPSTPIGQGQQVPSNQTPSPPPDMAAPNKTKNKKVKGGCLLSAPSKSCLPARG